MKRPLIYICFKLHTGSLSIYPIELFKIFDPKYGSPTSKLLLYVCRSKTCKTHKMQIFKAAFLVFFSKVIVSCFFLWCICLNFGAKLQKGLSILVFQGPRCLKNWKFRRYYNQMIVICLIETGIFIVPILKTLAHFTFRK